MFKKKMSIILIIALILINLFGCDKIVPLMQNTTKNGQETKNNQEIDDSYYSIIQGNLNKESDKYMETYIRYPKIVKSTNMRDSLVDPINDEITKEIDEIVKVQKSSAYELYKTYLKSSVENIENDRNKKIEALKTKYKNIIGSDEVKSISEITNNKINNKATDSILTGFATTEDIINQGPHNKKIIVIETTEITQENYEKIKQTTTIVEGSPKEIIPPSDSDIDFSNENTDFDKSNIENNTDFDKYKNNFKNKNFSRASLSNARHKRLNENNDNEESSRYEMPTETTKLEIESNNKSENIINNESNIIKAEVGAETTNNILTLTSFYKELEEIKNIKIPSIEELSNSYLKTYIDCSYEIMCLDEDYISLYIDITSYRTGNLINEKRIFKNIDIKNNKIVTLKDILGDNYKEKCIKTIKTKIENFDEELKKDLKPNYNLEEIINDNTLFFINNNHLPVLSIERNQITIGPVGYLSFVIK